VRTIVTPGGEFSIRANAKPDIDPNNPNKLALNNVEENVFDIVRALITGTTITAEMSNNPVMVIDIETKSATQIIRKI